MTFVTIDALDVRYGDVRVVRDFSLAINEGEFVALLGPSGCGKTTILRAISGLLPPHSGSIEVAGSDVSGLPVYKRNMGYVFQNYALFPHLSVFKNVKFGLEMRHVSSADAQSRVRDALSLVRLSDFAERRPKQLSGGQQQRVALARALVIAPQLLLLDECLSNLDAKLREELRDEIRDIQKRLGITTIFVTHDQTEALTMCDRIAVLNRGELMQIGTPRDIYERPGSPFVARFIGRINETAAVTRDGQMAQVGSISFRLPQKIAAGNIHVMVRPHRVTVDATGAVTVPGRQSLEGTVTRKTFIGNIVQIEARTDAGLFVAEAAAASATFDNHQIGEPVRLSWAIEDTLVFADTESAA